MPQVRDPGVRQRPLDTQVSGCGTLNSASQFVGSFTLTHASIGYHYRIAAVYVRSSTDPGNASNVSAWQYVIAEP